MICINLPGGFFWFYCADQTLQPLGLRQAPDENCMSRIGAPKAGIAGNGDLLAWLSR